MDRMSVQDASFLYVEDANNPMHVGSVATFEGPAPKYGDVVRMVVRKLHLVPRYRQKVRFPPFQLGRPVWVDDPHFQILYHVRHTAVPPPGGDEQLRNLAGRVLAQHLDRTKPLWELWMVEGLEGGRWALVSKVHHSMVDGIASTDLMSVLFEAAPDERLPAEVPWRAGREPSDAALLADALASTLTSPMARLQAQALPGLTLLGPRDMLEAWRGFTRSWSGLRPTPASLNGSIGPHRRWSWAKGSLDEVKQIKAALGGTVNDVVLAVITAGFRELLVRRGEPVEGRVVRTLVPVSVRGAHERGTFNNRVSALFPELPVGIADPVERLGDVRRQMDGLKESRQAVAGDVLTQLSGFTPPVWLAMASRLATRFPQRLVQTVTTNVPGPQQPLYVRGRRMLECYPYVPVGGQVRVGIAIFSYAGNLTFGVTGDYDTMADLEVLTQGIRGGVDELTRLARRRTSGTGRTRRARSRRAASGGGVPAGAGAG